MITEHCPRCGAPFPADTTWPNGRTCSACGHISWKNPLPAGNFLQAVEGGTVIVLRRNINPMKGHLATPGGFIERHESWQVATAREMLEEHGLLSEGATLTTIIKACREYLGIHPMDLRPYSVLNYPGRPMGIFGLSPVIMKRDALLPFVPNSEATERVLATADTEIAFEVQQSTIRHFLTRHWTGDEDQFRALLEWLPHPPLPDFDDIDARVSAWHRDPKGMSLPEYLGWSPQEYAAWVEGLSQGPG